MMIFVLKTRNCVPKTRNCVSKLMNLAARDMEEQRKIEAMLVVRFSIVFRPFSDRFPTDLRLHFG